VTNNDDFRYFYERYVEKNFHLLEASNGKEAWEKILESSPDIINSDV
jgi:hypothetical protein